MDKRLLSILVCPLCKGKLVLHKDALICRFDRLSYPIRDGIPVMLEADATLLTVDDIEKLPS